MGPHKRIFPFVVCYRGPCSHFAAIADFAFVWPLFFIESRLHRRWRLDGDGWNWEAARSVFFVAFGRT